jgi:ribonuclease D
MPVVAAITAIASVGVSVVQAVNSADAAGKAKGLADQQNTQQQESINSANNQQSEYIRQQALIGQRDQGLMAQRNLAAWRSNFAGTQLTAPGSVVPQAGMSKTTIGG